MEGFFTVFINRLRNVKHLNLIIIFFVWLICIAYALIPGRLKQVKDLQLEDVKYSGQISVKSIEGQGKVVYPDGEVYQGSFKNNQFDGEGHFADTKSRSINGYFKNGKAIENSQVSLADNNIWQIGPDNTWTKKSLTIETDQSSENENGETNGEDESVNNGEVNSEENTEDKSGEN